MAGFPLLIWAAYDSTTEAYDFWKHGIAKPAKVIALTGSSDSHLSRIADVCMTTISEEVTYRTDAMVSRIVQTAIIDTLYTAVGLRKGTPIWDRVAKTKQRLSYLKY